MDQRGKIKMFFERKQVADQVVKARNEERKPQEEVMYVIDRTGKESLYRMGGLKYLFEYIKSLNSHKVLDIGSGTGRGICGISQMPISSGLDFDVTVLTNNKQLGKYFPREKIHITPVETLKGIPNSSTGGVLGINSIAYARYPRLAVKRIDEILVPGGVVKATFDEFGSNTQYGDSVLRGPEKFIEAFSLLGYDVSFTTMIYRAEREDNPFLSGKLNSLVLAIKPGNPQAPSSQKLLDGDYSEIKLEAKSIQKDGTPVFNIDD